jgi:hypothetical protein
MFQFRDGSLHAESVPLDAMADATKTHPVRKRFLPRSIFYVRLRNSNFARNRLTPVRTDEPEHFAS